MNPESIDERYLAPALVLHTFVDEYELRIQPNA